MIAEWEDLLQHGIETSGYDQAIKYYSELKNKMINQLVNTVKQDNKIKKINYDLNNEIEEEILKNTSDWSENFTKAIKTLNDIENDVKEILENDDFSDLKHHFEEIKKQSEDASNKVTKQRQVLKENLSKEQQQLLKRINRDEIFIKNMLNVSQGSDVKDLVAQMSSYYVRYLYSVLMNDNDIKNFFVYARTMGGYYKELFEYEILSKYILKISSKTNVYHTGGQKIQKKTLGRNITVDSELDIIISQLNDMKQILSDNVELTDQIIGLKNVDIQNLTNKLLEEINWFGEQVKSSQLGKTDVYKIGNRTELFKNFKVETNGEIYSTLQSMQFLARFQNILISLGISNVLFSAGGQRFWMDQFIREFYSQRYLLAFYRQNNESPLTGTVVLEQFYTQKKAIRQRILT